MLDLKRIALVCLLPVLCSFAGELERPVMGLYPVETNAAQKEVAWSTQPGIRYELQESTNLLTWTTMDGYPDMADALAQQQLLELQQYAPKRYFRVLARDEQPPEIVPQSPADGAFAVPRFSTITVALSDASGVDTNTISMTVDTLGTFTLTDAQLSWSNGVLTFWNGGDVALGPYGTNVQVSVAAADVNGFLTDRAWQFDLEKEPVVDEGLFVFGSPTAQRAGQRVGMIATRILAERMNGGPIRMSDADPWTLDEVNASAVIIAYSNTPPSFDAGDYLANLTPATVDEIFYRRVTGTYDDAANKKLILFTEDVDLTTIVAEGSAGVTDESVVFEVSTNGVIVRALSGSFSKALPTLGFSLDGGSFKVDDNGWQVQCDGKTFSYGSPPPGGWSSGASLEMTAEECHFWLYPSLEASFQIMGGELERFKAVAKGDVESALIWQVDVLSGVTYEKNIFDLPDISNPRTTVFLGFIGVPPAALPVWADVALDMKVDLDAYALAHLQFRYGLRKEFSAEFGAKYANDQFDWVNDFDEEPTETVSTVSLGGELGMGLTLKPSVAILIYSLAGIETGPAVRGGFRAETEGDHLAGYLEGDADWFIGLAGPAFALLDPKPSFSVDIWGPAEWKLFPEDAGLAFTKHPSSQTVASGGSVTFECTVSAGSSVSYQWYKNNSILPGKTARTLTISSVSSGDAGSYKVLAAAGGESDYSDPATLTVTSPSSGSEFAYIPSGTFSMGDSKGDGYSNELPVHSVYVSSFYMSKTEITKAQWDEVYNWAVSHGYSFDNAGSGKGSSHPVHTVNWYDVVKWCNARSEKEGKTPCYTVGGNVYRTGQSAPSCNWSAGGYRLPTEAEWEKAARGGLSGKRFPWGDTIQHTRANYYSSSSYSYDTSSTRGYHPSYDYGGTPTSPVGSFSANGYGLYDMSGNVWEWCWDWYGSYPSGSVSNPRGASSGTYRVLRGGFWDSYPYDCRSANRGFSSPDFWGSILGFRVVR